MLFVKLQTEQSGKMNVHSIIALLFAASASAASPAVPADFRSSLNSGVVEFFKREDKSAKFADFLPEEGKFIPKLIGDSILAEWTPRLSPVCNSQS